MDPGEKKRLINMSGSSLCYHLFLSKHNRCLPDGASTVSGSVELSGLLRSAPLCSACQLVFFSVGVCQGKLAENLEDSGMFQHQPYFLNCEGRKLFFLPNCVCSFGCLGRKMSQINSLFPRPCKYTRNVTARMWWRWLGAFRETFVCL